MPRADAPRGRAWTRQARLPRVLRVSPFRAGRWTSLPGGSPPPSGDDDFWISAAAGLVLLGAALAVAYFFGPPIK